MEFIPKLILTAIVLAIIVTATFNILGKSPAFSRMPRFNIFKILLGLFKPDVFSKDEGAKFLKDRDIRQIISPKNKGLLIDGYSLRLKPEDSFKHFCLIAPTGGGKTTKFVIPNILTLAEQNCSMILTDPSGELYHQTSGYLAKKGFTIQTLNPTSPEASKRYNPLSKISSFTDIGELAHILVKSSNPEYAQGKDTFWYQGAETLITCLIQALKNHPQSDKYFNLGNVLHLLQNFGAEGEGITDFIINNSNQAQINQFTGIITGNPKVMQSFLSVAIQSLSMLNNPEIASLLSSDTNQKEHIEFSQFRQEKTVLFLIVPIQKIEYYAFILNIFYSQFFNYCMSKSPQESQRQLPIYAILDEFGNTSVPNFDGIATTIRKHNVSLSIVIQSISQLITNYGKERAKIILEGGILSKLYLSGLDIDTAQIVETMLGKQVVKSYKWNGEVEKKERNLLNADRIRTLADNKSIFFTGNKEPMLLKNKPYYQHRKMNQFTKLEPYPLRQRDIKDGIDYVDLG